ncbi:hypothetical protein NQZ68_000783 [Dissostichus eleginoides]|nr:hypothetical protein NQZ68_000783 [Dissostichus eleginoides]
MTQHGNARGEGGGEGGGRLPAAFHGLDSRQIQETKGNTKTRGVKAWRKQRVEKGRLMTKNHTGSRSHTELPPNIRHIPLLLTHGSQRKLEGHDEIGVKVNLKERDEGH